MNSGKRVRRLDTLLQALHREAMVENKRTQEIASNISVNSAAAVKFQTG